MHLFHSGRHRVFGVSDRRCCSRAAVRLSLSSLSATLKTAVPGCGACGPVRLCASVKIGAPAVSREVVSIELRGLRFWPSLSVLARPVLHPLRRIA